MLALAGPDIRMLLSYSQAFLFIHIDKVAGSSIQLALQPFASQQKKRVLRRRLVRLGALNRFGNLYRALEFPEHVTARTVQKCLPPMLYGAMFKFAFVRNPWDRLVSRYAFLLNTVGHPEHARVKGMTSFEQYIRWEIRRGKMFQHNYVADGRGRLILDFIGYYERLERDFAAVCARLGVQVTLPHNNRTNHGDYRSYYTWVTRELVARHFGRDAEFFGYDFDGLRDEAAILTAQQ
jgi:hypothetical protein